MTITSILYWRARRAYDALYLKRGWRAASDMWRRWDEWLKWTGRG